MLNDCQFPDSMIKDDRLTPQQALRAELLTPGEICSWLPESRNPYFPGNACQAVLALTLRFTKPRDATLGPIMTFDSRKGVSCQHNLYKWGSSTPDLQISGLGTNADTKTRYTSYETRKVVHLLFMVTFQLIRMSALLCVSF